MLYNDELNRLGRGHNGHRGDMQERGGSLQQRQIEDAIALYTQAIESNPTLLENYWQLGVAYLLRGDLEDAQEMWVSAMLAVPEKELDRATADLMRVLQVAAQQQTEAGHRAAAIQILEQVIDLDEGQADIHNQLGYLLAQQGRLDEAIASWQRATALNPDLTDAYERQADLLQRLDQFDDAIACYTQVLQVNPDDLSAIYNVGLCWLHLHQFEQAIAYLQRATQLDPSFAPAYGDGGMALILNGQLLKGVAHLHQAMSLKPAFAQHYGAWVNTLEQDVLTPAIQHNADLVQALLQTPSAQLFQVLGIVLADRGLVKGAIACFQQAVTLDSSLAKSLEMHQPLNQPPQNSPLLHSTEPSLTVDRPDGFYASTWEWVAASGLETSHYWPIYPASTLQFTDPKTLDQAIDIRFRFGDTMLLPGSFVVDIPMGRYWINEQSQTAVITPDNKLLGDISPDFPILSPGHPDKHPSNHAIFSLNTLPPSVQFKGKVAILSSLFNDAYFHWMVDLLPRAELLRLSGIDLAEINYFLVNNRWPFQREALEKLAIPADRILDPADYPHIQAEHLIVPSFPAAISWMPPWTCEFLRRLFGERTATSNPHQRLFISRNHTTNRRIINEVEITNALDKFGFQNVVLESLSIVEQAALLAHAEVVIAPHGGGLTNLIFCQPGTKIIELFSPNYVYPCYWLVSNVMQLDYYYLLGQLPVGSYFNQLLYPNPRTEDMFIDPNMLLDLLTLAGIDS
jgi:tetratricopeptide (TPR) repeat protein